MNCHKGGLVKFAAIGLLVSMTVLGGATNANANHPTNKGNFIKNYATTGKWRILHGDGDSCVAETDNGQVALRLKFTEYTGDFHIGMPYYQHQTSVTGDYGFSRRTNISIRFETHVIDSWAMAFVDAAFENQLRSESQIGFFLDRGLQMFSLDGSSNAIDLMKECAKNLGVKPRNQMSQNNQRNNRNNNNRQNNQKVTAPGQELHYASVRGWSVDVVNENNAFLYCGATNASRHSRMRIAHDGRRWGIGLETTEFGTGQGELFIEVDNGQTIHGGQVTYDHGTDGWASTELSFQFVTYLKKGNKVSMDIGNGFQNFSLSGSTAAILKLEECASNKGRKPFRQAVQPSNNRPVFNQNNQQNNRRNNQSYNIPVKRVLRGTWVWADRQKNAQQNAIVSSIEMTEPDTARYCYGFPCWDVRVTKDAGNMISFSHDGVSHFEFWETGHNRISGRFWENFNARGAPHATVNMR